MERFRVNKNFKLLFLLICSLVLLGLSVVNINNFTYTKGVLGIQQPEPTSEKFWSEFLSKNPTYVTGWLEIGERDKAVSIDPNYEGLTN
jgi:uncharacterized membrane-anchored protein YitT (DUF2179 family)